MTSPNSQELRIVEAFSSASVPERIIRESNIKELIRAMTTEQHDVQSRSRQLDELRQQHKEGNFLGNWWNDRGDKVQEAQLDLNKSIGRLTEKSSQLLIVNTAISKVLNDQQKILLQQQSLLKLQTDSLEQQNQKILDQQTLLEQQQREINKANRGLMEAKGLTQEQAQQLVGCVKQVREAESRISSANEALHQVFEQQLHRTTEEFLARMEGAFTEQQRRSYAFEQRLNASSAASAQQLQGMLEKAQAKAERNNQTVQQQITALTVARQQQVEEMKQQNESIDHLAISAQQLQDELKTATTAVAANIQLLEGQIASLTTSQRQQLEELEQQILQAKTEQSNHLRSELVRFTNENTVFQTRQSEQQQSEFKAVQQKLSLQDSAMQDLREEYQQKLDAAEVRQIAQQKNASRTRIMLGLVATLTMASLGWQAVVHYGLL